jgi:hypothetical protein
VTAGGSSRRRSAGKAAGHRKVGCCKTAVTGYQPLLRGLVCCQHVQLSVDGQAQLCGGPTWEEGFGGREVKGDVPPGVACIRQRLAEVGLLKAAGSGTVVCLPLDGVPALS